MRPRLDILGALLSIVGLITLLFGVIEGPSKGWTDPLVIGAFVVAVVSLMSFVFWERHTDHPMLEIGFFANPRFTAASIAVTFVFFAMFGSLFFVSQYLQFVLGYSALESGVGLLPLAASLMIAAPVSAKLVSVFGTKIVVTLGLVLVAAALVVFSFVSDDEWLSVGCGRAGPDRCRHGVGDGAGDGVDHGFGATGEGRASARR